MTQPATARTTASKVAKWLVDKGRAADAVAMLSAWAASGPNDAEGQQLLAGALRIDAASPAAKQAFARMEGLEGEAPDLEAAILRFGLAELQKLEREMSQPSFNRAQVGFNNNVKYKDHVYHIQTEDSGLNKPHIITHLFADGGRVIKSHKRTYASEVSRDDVALHVRGLMKGQQMEMIVSLRDGKFDLIIAGKAIGGMETLEHPPKVDIKRVKKKEDAPPARSLAPSEPAISSQPQPPAQPTSPSKPAPPVPPRKATPPPLPMRAKAPSQTGEPLPLVRPPEADAVPLVRAAKLRFRVHVLRSLVGGPEIYEPVGDEVAIGSSGGVALPGERFCHPREALIIWRKNRAMLEDVDGGNGVFLRVRRPVELEAGDEFIIGDQLLRVEKNPTADDGPDPDPTYFYSSPKWPSSFRVVQVFEGGANGACVVARGTTLQVGSVVGDLVFPNDPLVSDQHCYIEEQAGSIVLTDLQSRTGVFVRVKAPEYLEHGDQFIVGRTRLALDLTPSNT